MYKNLWLVCFPIFLFGCGSQSETDHKAEVSLQKKVFVVHDKLMAEMDNLVNIQKKLKSPELMQNYFQKSKVSDTVKVSLKIHQVYDSLESANDAMMNWMDGFKVDYKGKNHEATMNYLEDQFKKVNSINSRFTTHIKAADSIISKLK